MFAFRRFFLVAAFAWLIASPAAAQESWVGKTILVKRDGIKLRRTDDMGRQVQVADLFGFSQKVLDDKNGWLLVKNEHGVLGWFEKADAVPVEGAVAFYSARIQQNAKDADAYIRRSVAFSMSGKQDDAQKDCDAAIQLEPKNVGAYCIRARVRAEKMDFEKSFADFDQALRIDPKNARALLWRGMIWAMRKDLERACQDWSEVLRLDPRNVEALNNRGGLWSIKLVPCPN